MDERLNASMPEDQKAVFERVWKRVMNGSKENSPIVWGEDVTVKQTDAPVQGSTTTEPVETTEVEVTETTTPSETPPEQEDRPLVPVTPAPTPTPDHPQNDFPSLEDLGVLGPSCMEWVPLLQELIRRALGDWKEYQKLARRVGGFPGRVFSTLGKEKLRQAKRLSAAEFLISGIRYWPDSEGYPPASSYLGTLRRRFMAEQENMAACLVGADGTTDPSLAQLFLDLAKEDWGFAEKIRGLVEQV